MVYLYVCFYKTSIYMYDCYPCVHKSFKYLEYFWDIWGIKFKAPPRDIQQLIIIAET